MLPRSALLSLSALVLSLAAGPAGAHPQTPPAAAPASPTAPPLRSAPMFLVIYRAGPAWKTGVVFT